jgi:signal recognition particle receptor subunit beta
MILYARAVSWHVARMVWTVSSSGNIGLLVLLDNAPAPALIGRSADDYTLVCRQETRIDAKHLES